MVSSHRPPGKISLGAAVAVNEGRSRARRSRAVAERRAKRTLDRMSSAGRREQGGAQREISLGEPELLFLCLVLQAQRIKTLFSIFTLSYGKLA